LILGSGAIKIGEAAEFDYSGSQALKALKEEGITTVLINPNIATIQTSQEMADRVYLLPLEFDFVVKVIEKEQPDGIFLGFGGQNALSLGIKLEKSNILKEYNISVLGTPIEGIERALNRNHFRQTMLEEALPIPPSNTASSVAEAVYTAAEIGFPVMVRVSFNLGGRGSFIAWNREQFSTSIARAFAQSEIREVLIEKYLHHWKEVEFEVVRDRQGNTVAVACMENVEPMGVHTGDSIVVAPSQTLTNREYYLLRKAAIRVAEAVNIIGECNVQLALDPCSENYYIIETNPRMSRSSALASKVTGYPLAYIAAKLALGYTLQHLKNGVTGTTTALFEPSLDYVVVKMPRWDLEKFEGVNRSTTTEMKSIGEVMAIGRTLHECFQKAVRMVSIDDELIGSYVLSPEPLESVLERIHRREPYAPLHIAKALYMKASVEDIHTLTGIDPFYLSIFADIVDTAQRLQTHPPETTIHTARIQGFSRDQIEILSSSSYSSADSSIKVIDTLAGEYPAQTNYLYMTCQGQEHDIPLVDTSKIIILGAGVFRIGVSVEFDWAVVNFTQAARKRGLEVLVLNHNPETVSTDWDITDKLYFEEVTLERVLDIHALEHPQGVVVFSGGQLANSLAQKLEGSKVPLLGTRGKSVDQAENRARFSSLLERLSIKQPSWIAASSQKEVILFARDVGYPVMIRPSYVLSGTAMKVAYHEKELISYLGHAATISSEYPVVVSKYLQAYEAEIDAVSDGKKVVGVTSEHIERAGIHSGDATMVTPYRFLRSEQVANMQEIALELALALDIVGPFNIQFLVNHNVHVLELNLRTSRSMPFSSKSRGVNLMELSAQAVFDGDIQPGTRDEYYELPAIGFCVKSPQFSWSQLRGAYPFLGAEMRSTGEVASMGNVFEDALVKSWLSVKPHVLPRSQVLIYGYDSSQQVLSRTARILEKSGQRILSVSDGIGGTVISEEKALSLLQSDSIDLVMTSGYAPQKDFTIRRTAADLNVPLVLDETLSYELAQAFTWAQTHDLETGALSDYYQPENITSFMNGIQNYSSW
jgi:carbamoyl-phosphate synthase large subunit